MMAMLHTYKARIVEDSCLDDAYEANKTYEAYSAGDAAEKAAEDFHDECDRAEDSDWPMRIGVRHLLDDVLQREQIFTVYREIRPEFSAYPEVFDQPPRFQITHYLIRRYYCTRPLGHAGDCDDFRDHPEDYPTDWSREPDPPYCRRRLIESLSHEAAL